MAKINFINTVKRKCQIWKKNILDMQHSLVEPLFSIPSSFEQWLSRKPHPCVPTDECVCTCMFIMKHTIPWANRRLCCLSNGWKKKKAPICSPQLQQMWPCASQWPVLKAAKSWSIDGKKKQKTNLQSSSVFLYMYVVGFLICPTGHILVKSEL